MDWSPRQPFLAKDADSLGEFEYGVYAPLPLTVVQGFRSRVQGKLNLERFASDDVDKPDDSGKPPPDFWRKLNRSPIFHDDAKAGLPSGVCIFFCPRAEDIFEDIPANLSDLCMTRDQWELVATKFYLQNSLVKAMQQKVTSITVDSHEREGTAPSDTLLMCTINTSTASHEGFAVSTSHFKQAKLTLAVVLGATEQQVGRIEFLLRNADEAIGHPLLMLGLSAELLLDLLTDLIEHMRDKCIQVTRKCREMLNDTSSQGTDYAMEVETIRSETSHLDEEVQTSKQSLQKALEFYCPDYKDIASIHNENDIPTGAKHERFVKNKIKMRFQDIFFELDSLMTLTRISVQEMSSMSATIVAVAARRDAAVSVGIANDSARTAKTGTLIAFLAMLYLPMTTVATIVSMPIFNYENDWRDWRYRPAPQSDSPSGDGTATSVVTDGPPPVFSGYFWVYFAVSIALSFATIEVWWRVVRNTNHTSDKVEKPKEKPPHWTLYLVWPLVRRLINSKKTKEPDVDAMSSEEALDKTVSTADTETKTDTGGTDEKVGETGGCGASLFRRMIPKLKKKSTAGTGEEKV